MSRPATRPRHLHAVTSNDTVVSEVTASDTTASTPNGTSDTPPVTGAVRVSDPELAAAIARHPAGTPQWRDVDLSTISHLSLPEIAEVCTAFDLELRIQTRRSPRP